MFCRPEDLGGMGGDCQCVLAVLFIYLYLGNFGSIQQFVSFDIFVF